MNKEISNYDDLTEAPFRGLGGIKEAIILAGGLGTRLRDTVPDLPKCMVPVNDRPFLFYLVNFLRSEGIEKFIFSLGYKHEVVREYLDKQFAALNFECIVEKEPLGTGGAILAACYKITEENVLVVNGDTLFKISLNDAAKFHQDHNSSCTLLLKPMGNFDRFGAVELNPDSTVKCFREKQFFLKGYINGGNYLINSRQFLEKDLPAKFSLETDYLKKVITEDRIYGLVQDKYFIDIGTPEDYEKAREELKKPPLELKNIDNSWTIFLDRDGVINHERKDEYVLNWGDFEFYTGAREAIKTFSQKFGKIIVVTNQRSVDKGLLTENDLLDIHDKMKGAIELAGGRIDGIYYCTDTGIKHPRRKPNPGMAFSARNDFPVIDLEKSIVAGNKSSDMLFGRNAGMYTAFIATTNPGTPFLHPDIDLYFHSLIEFAKAL